MKKLFLVISLMSISYAGYSQWSFGLKQGLNLSRISYTPHFELGQNYIKQDYKRGYCGGLVIQYFNAKYLGIQAEVLYSDKGFMTKYDTLNNTQYERDIPYLTIPVMTHFYILNKKTSPFLLFGGFASMALSSRETFTDHHLSGSVSYSFLRNRDNRGDYGLVGGAGIKRKFSFGTLQIQAEYSYSFNNLYKWGYQSNNPDFDRFFKIPQEALNQAITFSLTYLFTLKPKTSHPAH